MFLVSVVSKERTVSRPVLDPEEVKLFRSNIISGMPGSRKTFICFQKQV